MDDEKLIWEVLSDSYQHLVLEECLCDVNSPDILGDRIDEILFSQIIRNTPRSEEIQELQLLSCTLVQHISKLYLHSNGSFLCEKIVTLAKHVINDSFLNAQAHCLISDGNKFLHRAVLRSLKYQLYMLDEDMLSDRIKKLLDILKSNLSMKSSINLLNLFELFMDYSLKSAHILESHNVAYPICKKMACKKKVQIRCSPLEDLKLKCWAILCNNWVDLVEKFFSIRHVAEQSDAFIAFLCLWRSSLKAIHGGQEVLKPLFNNEELINIFVSVTPVEPMSLKIFLEILIQALSLEASFVLCDSRQNEYQGGELLITALNTGLLENLPIEDHKCGFGGVCGKAKSKAIMQSHLGSCSKRTENCDEVAVKKIVFIVLRILSASKISARLIAAFWNTEVFTKGKMHFASDMPVHLWILDLFFDQDDLLIGALLSSLHLYINLGVTVKAHGVPNDDIIRLRSSLNPHKSFIVFVQRLGGHHHVIIDFLASNETCILDYLMQYLKLAISEWELFVSAHNEFKESGKNLPDGVNILGNMEPNICDNKYNSVEAASDFNLKKNSCLSSSVPLTATRIQQTRLVSYSSSSSCCSDSELSPSVTESSFGSYACNETISIEWTISVLVKLRKTLEKLVVPMEFPYRVNPLIELIKKCENMSDT